MIPQLVHVRSFALFPGGINTSWLTVITGAQTELQVSPPRPSLSLHRVVLESAGKWWPGEKESNMRAWQDSQM